LYIMVGLGNPGLRYKHTRHNMGFLVIELLSRLWNIPLNKQDHMANWGQGRWGNQAVLLAKPNTYMNLSGQAVQRLITYFKIDLEKLLVIHDDLDLPLGRLKFVLKGGAGGHRGVSSIIQYLKTNEFFRLKVGIDRPHQGEPAESYVLRTCDPEEEAIFNSMITRAAGAVEIYLTSGISQAMSQFHGPPLDQADIRK
jgi:peptidyl-tRNA hydrolase, PTH1 family